MAVAENAVKVLPAQGPNKAISLGVASLAGGAIVLLGLWLVFGGLPVFWSEMLPTGQINEFLSGALLLIAGIAALTVVCFVWRALDKSFAAPGVRAGAIVGAVILFVVAWVLFTLGNALAVQEGMGLFVTLVVAALLAAGLIWITTRPGYGRMLVDLEEQGWFHAIAFKGNQGMRVRRATVLGVLVIGISGIITLVTHGTLGSSRVGANDWFWFVPFTSEPRLYVPLLFRVNVLGPLLLGAALFWFAWRLVNWPTFADFLIATEAEMNKVSWTTRPRLIQDTIVVLVTTVLLTTFLFAVDILWFQILNSPWVGVLRVDIKAEQQKQQEKTQW